ncbi:sulfatase-like hydrolase/transferase [bacterium]|nr:sulfatase-like hydrolase/transferase [bacterium]
MLKQRIVLVIFDSLAMWIFRKFLELYPSSFMAKMAREGMSFERNYSTCTYSYPSYPSILYGVYPYEHGILSKMGYRLNGKNGLKSIHECLKEEGWKVATYSDETWIFEESTYGLSCHVKGDAYAFDTKSGYEGKTFIFLNFWGTHHPWNLTKPYDTKSIKPNYLDMERAYKNKDWDKVTFIRECWVSRSLHNLLYYDEKISHLDDGNTVIVLGSDHGEDIYIHGLQGTLLHEGLPWETVLRIPLIIYPCDKSKRIENLWSNIFLKETILGLTEDFDSRKIDLKEFEYVQITGTKVEGAEHCIASAGYVFDIGMKYFVEGMLEGKPKEHLYILKEEQNEENNCANNLPIRSHYEDFWKRDGKILREKLKKEYPFIFDSELLSEHINRSNTKKRADDEIIKQKLHALGYL